MATVAGIDAAAGSRLSATIRAFSSKLQRRRRPTPEITSSRRKLSAFVPVVALGSRIEAGPAPYLPRPVILVLVSQPARWRSDACDYPQLGGRRSLRSAPARSRRALGRLRGCGGRKPRPVSWLADGAATAASAGAVAAGRPVGPPRLRLATLRRRRSTTSSREHLAERDVGEPRPPPPPHGGFRGRGAGGARGAADPGPPSPGEGPPPPPAPPPPG